MSKHSTEERRLVLIGITIARGVLKKHGALAEDNLLRNFLVGLIEGWDGMQDFLVTEATKALAGPNNTFMDWVDDCNEAELIYQAKSAKDEV